MEGKNLTTKWFSADDIRKAEELQSKYDAFQRQWARMPLLISLAMDGLLLKRRNDRDKATVEVFLFEHPASNSNPSWNTRSEFMTAAEALMVQCEGHRARIDLKQR